MAEQAFIEWNPRKETMCRVQQCIDIVDEYANQGLKLTLRQLYYQLVSRDLIVNEDKSYKNLGSVLAKARLAGYVDWEAIEDRGRQPDEPPEWTSLDSLVRGAISAYRLPRWDGQDQYCELWVEKEALAGVLEPMASKYHVTLMVNKGYSSLSAMYASGKRILRETGHGEIPATVFYLGDLDPSGEDMVRDVRDRLLMFTDSEVDLTVTKLALTPAQVEQYGPPPNPTKVTDSRAKKYIEIHGHECWEVDALDPTTLQRVISRAFDQVIDVELMDAIKDREEDGKQALRDAAADL